MKIAKALILLLLIYMPLSADSNNDPLTESQLRSIVPNATFQGRFEDSNRPFAVYFAPNGKIYLQKSGESQFNFYGNWKIIGNLLEGPWPYKDLSTSSQKTSFYQERDLRVYKLQLFQVGENIYEPFRPKYCNCESAPEVYFPKVTRSSGKVSI